ncbi:TMV resistance protein N [Eucalyptus grandis]|uniref:TMV resistance protein N n=1 Tax=Eucalyptus grandis TaxID=71139 RepID=UPI00192E9AAD|nr:TMV resistance protein N [Eucalyptus grandis]
MASSSSKERKRSYDVMASSSSKKSKRSYDVFLSFRGPDVRKNFLDHLYVALDQAGIFTYIDSEELRKGEQISPALMKAIKESQIAIVVFSVDYASSSWCLEELTKIMECREQKGLKVFPVFYKVEPREVRWQRQSYGEAMAKHEVKFGKDSEKVNRWKKALCDAGNLSGEHFTDGYEAGLIQHIIQEISTQLSRTPLYVDKDLVGIDFRVQKLKTILNLQSEDDVLMVGLWGQGGVGKTTLAKAIHNAIFRDFQGASFLEHVRENSNDLVLLQKKLLSQLLPGKELPIYNVGGGRQLIKQRLCSKKVLIILDDVDNAHQLNALAKEQEWFGEGSRIIITTRNKHLLTSHGINPDHIYEVKALKEGEALELLRKHAFRGNQEIEISSNLVHQVLHYARGLPLALQVLGAFLCGRGEDEWESTLQKLAETPDEEINDVLKVSYDGLEPYAKEIFLHIACFFKGRSTEYIKKVLDSCDFHTTIGIKILIERCLITEGVWTIQMHDLIQLMGMNIVKDEDRDDPINRSRLWLRDDVLDVLSEDKETKTVKAIVLQLPEPEDMHIGPDAFTKMKNLKLLILLNVDNSIQGPIHLPNGLRWFEWPNCGSTLEFCHGPKKLVGLDMRNSKIKGAPRHFKDLQNLKFINFSSCQSLVCTPNLDGTPNLKELHLNWCKNLERVHESVAYHGNLQVLNLYSCSKLHHFPDVLRTKNLLFLGLDCCSKLQRFPDIPDKIKGLHRLSLTETSIEELPASIENLVSLENIDLSHCKKLAILPPSIYKLENLKNLNLSNCSKLMKFPKKEEDSSDPHAKTGFPQLLYLTLNECNLSEVEFLENPSCFPRLNKLDVSGCHQLKEILKIPRKLHSLIAKDCKSLSKIPSDIHHVQDAYLPLCPKLVNNGSAVNDLVNLEHFNPKEHYKYNGSSEFLLPGGEMPQWLRGNEEGEISFIVSKEFFKKFMWLAAYVVFQEDERMENFHLCLHALINGKRRMDYMNTVTSSLWDHVCLQIYEMSWLWEILEDVFGRSQFHLMIRADSDSTVVKECGFRLICKPLENDLKDDQLMDPAILYEIQNEDYLTSRSFLEIKPSQEWMDEFTVEKWRYSLISPDLRIVCPGGEMPKEFVFAKDSTISFMASREFFDKFRGLAFCVVIGVEGGEKKISFDIVPQVHGQRRNVLSGTLGSFDLDHVWIQYLEPNVLWGVLEGGVDFGQFNERYLQFSIKLSVSGGIVKRLGYVLRCTQLEDDLKVMLENNQLVDPAILYEDCDGYPEEIGEEFVRRFAHTHREKQEASESETD